MMPDRTTVNNAFYWGTIDPLDVRAHSVLRNEENPEFLVRLDP